MMPTKDQVSRAIELIRKSSTHLSYFFRKLNNAAWIAPLNEYGLFRDPPNDENCGGGIVRPAHPWPQANYLARMMMATRGELNDELMRIIVDVGRAENWAIHMQFTEAAVKSPSDVAERWATAEIEWIQARTRLAGLHGHELGSLVCRLAQVGHIEIALRLARVLLELLHDREDGSLRDGESPRVEEPVARLDKHDYDEILNKVVPDLMRIDPEKTFGLLSDLMERALMIRTSGRDEACRNDWSTIHRPAIGDHSQNMGFQFGDGLITAWRNAAVSLVEDRPDALESVIQDLERRRWNLFCRLALHLLRVARPAPVHLIEERLTDRSILFKIPLHHEVWNLLHEHFSQLSTRTQQRILSLLEEGEDPLSEGDSLEQIERHRRFDQYRWLLALEDHLDEAWRTRLGDLREEFGKPSMPPDFLSWMGGPEWRSPKSPLSLEKLATMPRAELVDYLRSWRPAEDWGATPSGLGSNVSAMVERMPASWAEDLALFRDDNIDPTYIRCVVEGFRKAVESGNAIPWKPVLGFCLWIAELAPVPTDPNDRPWLKPAVDVDRDWTPAQMQVGWLIEKGLEPDDEPAIPIDLRDAVWCVIEALCRNVDPPLGDERDTDSSRMMSDPLTRSMNTVRGTGLHVAIRYAMWIYKIVANDLKREREAREPDWREFPEVRDVVESRFDPAPTGFGWSTTDRAVLGWWLPQLAMIDAEWVRNRLPSLFPAGADLAHLWKSAWESYLSADGPFGPMFDVIHDVYFQAVRSLRDSATVSGEDSDDNVGERLASHVFTFYFWRKVGLEQGDLVDLFFTSAQPGLRAKALNNLAQNLTGKESLSREALDRLRDLWEWRVASAGGLDAMPDEELISFGFWFSSGLFEPEWCFRYLPAALARPGKHWSETQVLDQLAAVFDGYPSQTLDCLRRMVERRDDLWFFMPREDGPAWRILERGLVHSDPVIRDEAEAVTNLLGAKGFWGYRELLRKHRGPDGSRHPQKALHHDPPP